MADHGPHNPECATAKEAECHCRCHGAGHGVAHMPGSLKNKFHQSGGSFTVTPVKSPSGKTHYYVVTNEEGKSPGGANINPMHGDDHIASKPTIAGEKTPIAKHAQDVKVTATAGEKAPKAPKAPVAAPKAQPEHVQLAVEHATKAKPAGALVRAKSYDKLSKDEFDALPAKHKQAITEDLQAMSDGEGDAGLASSKLAASVVGKLFNEDDGDGEGDLSAPTSGPVAAPKAQPEHVQKAIEHATKAKAAGALVRALSYDKLSEDEFDGLPDQHKTAITKDIRTMADGGGDAGAASSKLAAKLVDKLGIGDKPAEPTPAPHVQAHLEAQGITPGATVKHTDSPDEHVLLDVNGEEAVLWNNTTKSPSKVHYSKLFKAKSGSAPAAPAAKKAAPAAPAAPAAKKAAPAANAPAGFTAKPAGGLTPTGQHLGTHGAQVHTDENGAKFLVKPAEAGKSMVPHAEAAVSELSNKVGLATPQVSKLGPGGTIQPMVDSKPAFPGGFDPKKLSSDDILAIQKHHVLDWMTSQHDAHKGNWLRTPDGKLVEIDKGQALKFLGKDKLASSYHPNKVHGEDDPIYNHLLKAAGKGDVQLHDPSSGELKAFIDTVQGLPDDEVKGMFKSYADALAAKGNVPSADGFLDKLVARKNSLGQAFADLHKNEGITHPHDKKAAVAQAAGQVNVTAATPAKKAAPAAPAAKAAAPAAPAAKKAAPAAPAHPDGNFSAAQDHLDGHGIKPGDKVSVKYLSGTYTYHGLDNKSGLAKVKSPHGGESNVPANHVTKAAAPAAPAKAAAPAAPAAPAKGSHGLTPGDVVQFQGEPGVYVYHGDSDFGLAKVQSLPSGAMNFTADHDELKKVHSPAPHQKAAAKQLSGIDAYSDTPAPAKAAGSVASGDKKAATADALAKAGINHGDIVIAKGKVHSHVVTGVSDTGQVHLQNAYTGAKWTAGHEDLTKSPKPGKVAQAAAEKWKQGNGGQAGTAAPTAAPAKKAAAKKSTAEEHIANQGIVKGDTVTTASGNEYEFLGMDGQAAIVKVKNGNAFTYPAKGLTKVSGSSSAAAKAAPAKKAAAGALKHPAAVQKTLDAQGIKQGDVVGSTLLNGQHIYKGPVPHDKHKAYLYSLSDNQLHTVAAANLWKPSGAPTVPDWKHEEADIAVGKAKKASEDAGKLANATASQVKVKTSQEHAADNAAMKALDAQRPAIKAKASIPAAPLAALLDRKHDFTDETLLEQMTDGMGTPAQRQKLMDDLRKFQDLAQEAKSAGYYSYQGPIKEDAKKFANFRAACEHNHSLDARKKLEEIWPTIKSDQVRAACLQYVYERERTHGSTAHLNGMATGPQFTSDNDARKWADSNIEVPHVTATERAAVRTYTGSGYTTMNVSLRGGGNGAQYAAKVPRVSAAIQKSVLPEDTLLVRGEGTSMLHKLGGNEKDSSSFAALVGKEAQDRAFLSTSIGKKPALGTQVVWSLRVPKGTPGLYVDKPTDRLSATPGEREILLDRHTRRIIHAVYPHPDPRVKRVFIEAEVVPHDWVKPADWKPAPRGDTWKDFVNG